MTKDKEFKDIKRLDINEIIKNFKAYSEEVQMRLVREKDVSLVNFMDEETFMKLIAPSHPVPSKKQISDNAVFIKYLDDISEEFKLKAIEVNPYTILYMGMPSKKAIKKALEDMRFQDAKILMEIIGNQPEDMLKEMIHSRGCVIEILDNPNEKLKLEALKVNGLLIRHEENPSRTMKIEALKSNGLALEYIKDKDEELCFIAIKNTGLAIKFIENPSYDMCIAAVRENGLALSYISNQTEEMCIEALKQNPKAVRHIKKLTNKVKEEANKYTFSKNFIDNIRG